MSQKALVFVEFKEGQMKKSAQEALSLFHGLNWEVHTCSVGEGSEALAKDLGAWGVQHHHFCQSEELKTYNPESYQSFLSKVFQEVQPQYFIASSNSLGRDVFPRLAAEVNGAYVSDVTEMSLEPELKVKRPPILREVFSASELP